MFIDEDYWYSLDVDALTDYIDISELFGYEVETDDRLAKYLRKIGSTGNCEITG